MHDAITLGVPVLAIFFGILLNQRGLGELKADLKGDINRVESNIDRLQADLKGDINRIESNIDRLQADLKGDINRIESKIDRLQADLHQFNRELGRHDVRLDNLEESKRT